MKEQNLESFGRAHGYLINLDSRPDRLSLALSQIEELGLLVTRLSAVEAVGVDVFNGMLTSAQFACWESHLLAMKNVISSGADFGVIIEDDFLVKDFDSVRKILSSALPSKIDLLQIGWIQSGFKEKLLIRLINLETILFTLVAKTCFRSKRIDDIVGSRLRVLRAKYLANSKFIYDDFKSGAHFYTISKKLACEIIELKMVPMIPIDTFFATLALNHKYRIFRLRTSLVIQSNSTSSIKEMK